MFILYSVTKSFRDKQIDQWHVFGMFLLAFLSFLVYVL